MKIEFTIPGEPCGKGRPRFTTSGRAYTPAKTANYETLVKWTYQSHMRISARDMRFTDVPLRMKITAYYSIPASASEKKKREMRFGIIRPTKKPDWDNVGKIIADALNGIAYPDDAQIVEASVKKYYADDPRVEVEIEEVGE